MSYARQLLDTSPGTVNVDAGVLAAAIDALSECAQAWLCLDCADVCTATIGVTSRQAAYDANVTRPLLGGLRGHLQELRRRVRPACPAP
jgi:hypothetical protein